MRDTAARTLGNGYGMKSSSSWCHIRTFGIQEIGKWEKRKGNDSEFTEKLKEYDSVYFYVLPLFVVGAGVTFL